MKFRYLIFTSLALASCAKTHVVRDLTATNLFTTNCEGPAVDKAGHLFVVNFQQDGTIGQVDDHGQVSKFVELPKGSIGNAIQFDADGNMRVADFAAHNILKVDVATKTVSVFAHDDRFHQPNDICINRLGHMFASDPDWKNSTGRIWRIDPDGKVVLVADSLGTTNGIEFSPDEQILYVNESVQRKIWAFDVDDDGELLNKRLFHSFSDFGMDGMKCDRDGNLLVTRYDKGAIAILSPEGKLIGEVTTIGKKTSNICFGGPDGKTCYVTTQDRRGVETFRHNVPGRRF